MSNIKVRIGQQNAVKVTSSVSGGNVFANNATTALNVIGGIASVTQLSVSGISSFTGIASFNHDVYIGGDLHISTPLDFSSISISGILTVFQISYPTANPYGIAYFDSNKNLVSTSSTNFSITESNYILSTNNLGIPSWANSIDGGTY